MKANHKEALKLALDALDEFCELGAIIRPLEVRDALREALAEQPEQEPVAYLVDGDLYYPEEIDWETLQEQGHTVTPLYTSPPAQRTWVGLAKSEITTSLPYSITRDKGCFHAGALWAEAKLKEKNNA